MTLHVSNRSGARRTRGYIALAALAAFFCPAAHAIVLGACTASASGVAFGTYTPLTILPSTGTITVMCTLVLGSSSATIDLSTGGSNTFSARTMFSGANTLSYNLYLDAAHSMVWGDGTGGSQPGTLTINGLGNVTANATIYALIPSQDPAAPLPVNNYTDTIMVTVSY